MGTRERDAKSLQDKLKELFNAKKCGARGELELSPLAAELGPGVPPARRLRAVRELTDRLATHTLPPGGGERVWALVRDLVEEGGAAGGAALTLLAAARAAGAHRVALLRYLRDSLDAEGGAARLRLLRALLGGGRDLVGVEELAGPLLAEWLAAGPPQLLPDLMALTTAVVKYNASALHEHQLHAIVNATCGAMCAGEADAVLGGALELLEAVLAYAVLPRGALAALVRALCRCANLEAWAGPCWRLMRLVAGADLGHAALAEALALAAEAGGGDAAGVARGAVFLVHMSLWGGQRAPPLRASPAAVLPSLRLAVLSQRSAAVTYEVSLALQSLLSLCGRDLSPGGWAALLAVLSAALHHCDRLRPPSDQLHARVHAVITAVEQLQTAGHYEGDREPLLRLLDDAAPHRPEASVMWAVSARCEALCGAGAGAGAGAGLALAISERYIRGETRVAVRLHALHALMGHVTRHHAVYGDELVERVALPVLALAAADGASAVRAAAAAHAAQLARLAGPPALTDLVDLLEKILNRPPEAAGAPGEAPDREAGELRVAAAGLADLVRARVLRAPAAPAARALLVLLEHLEQHYRRPEPPPRPPDARLRALEVVMALRSNAAHCVGLAGAGRGPAVCSPLLVVEARREPAANAATVPAGRVARALVLCVTRERDWPLLRTVLRALPGLVGARALCVGRRAGDLEALAAALCALCEERGGRGAPSASELHAVALPALAALAPLQSLLEGGAQQRLVRCLLRHGLALRGAAAAAALAALGVWALEARDTMLRMLPEVLLDLSKVSDTPLVAAPMLELASTLARLPRVFASLAEDQYMAVFAVVLPYTNPSRYNHYVVSLAHHVIAAWFLKCRLAYRRNFVRFIIHGLHNYIIVPFEEQLQRSSSSEGNEDSGVRQRSSSLGARPPRVAPSRDAAASAALHLELTECCVDLLARHASAPVAATGTRGPAAHALFHGGPSATWLVGHRLVTVTTTGCQQHALKAGPCERCRARRIDLAESGTDHSSEVSMALQHFAGRLGAPVTAEPGGAEDAEPAPAACWGAQWAEVRVRAPTGDTAFTVRVQNRMGWEGAAPADALHELQALLAAPPDVRATASVAASAPGLGCDNGATAAEPGASPSASAGPHFAAPPATQPVVQPATQPINIPGSPQRQSSSSTTDDDDLVPPATEGKSRHPVRRSNSSPEMSSSWKMSARDAGGESEPDELLLLPLPGGAGTEPSASQQLLQNKKAAKKSDTRVSCEAIPEEVSGTSPAAPPGPPAAPQPHPHLLTHKSDPGSGPDDPQAESAPAPGDDLPPLARSKRSNTISVMSPTRRGRTAEAAAATEGPRAAAATATARAPAGPAPAAAAATGGATPAFVFLQLYHNVSTAPLGGAAEGAGGGGAPGPRRPPAERPLLVTGAQHERSLKTLDLVPPMETVAVGVVYVGPGQAGDEAAALRNAGGSRRYGELVRALGPRRPLPAAFVALEAGRDGTHATLWRDGALQVLFHVATDMPNHPEDPNANEKRKHIGNDFVSIVYNDSGDDFNIHTMKGQLNLCIVVVEPLPHALSRVSVRTKDERVRSQFLSHAEPLTVTDSAAPLLARQMALHASLASQISQSLSLGGGNSGAGAPFASNALERLRLVKRLRRRLESERAAAAALSPRPYATQLQRPHPIHDFNDYT